MARTDTLSNFLTDVANSIRNKTGDSSPIEATRFDTEIESISGGGYDGQLPTNSVIKRIVCVGNELRVYLNVDQLASGTRVYFKENNIPSIEDTYIDVPRTSNYGVIQNINLNSMYGIRVASYVIYDDNQKAFNNSNSVGSTAVKLTTQYNSAGAILLDLPVEVQGNSLKFTTYSKYTNTFYMGIASKLYKLDCTVSNPQFVQIGTNQTFGSNMRMTPTDQGLFIQGSSYWLLYNETNDTWTTTNISSSQYMEVLPNEDIFATSGTLYKYNKQTKTFASFNGQRNRTSSWYIYNGVNLYISTYYSNNSGMKIYKYDFLNKTYNLIANDTSMGDTRGLQALKEFHDILVIGANYYYIYYIKNNDGVIRQMLSGNNEISTTILSSETCQKDNKLVQDPNTPTIFYFIRSGGDYAYLTKIDLDSNTSSNISSDYNGNKACILFGDYIITSFGYYNIVTGTWTQKTLGARKIESFIISNNKLYKIGPTLGIFNTNTMSFDTIATITSDSSPNIHYINNGNKIYIYNENSSQSTVVGVYVLDTLTDTATQIVSSKLFKAVTIDNKVYFRGGNGVKQFIVNLNDDTYYISNHNSGETYLGISYSKEGGVDLDGGRPDTMIYDIDIQGLEAMYDSTTKKFYGLDKEFLDLSSSAKTYSAFCNAWYMYVYSYKGFCYQSNDYSEIVVLFTQQNNS